MTKLSYHLQTYKSKAGENGNDSFLISMSVSVCALVFAVLLVESVMRIFLPIFGEESFSVKKDNAIFSPDPIITNKLKPNKEFGHDKNGFKNEKMLDSYKVVALGDSHTYGGLRKTPWTQYLAKELGTMVYNMGVAGYGMAQYYYLLNQALIIYIPVNSTKQYIKYYQYIYLIDLFCLFRVVLNKVRGEAQNQWSALGADPTSRTMVRIYELARTYFTKHC